MIFDMLTGTTGSHLSLLIEVREMTPFQRWEPAGFYLTARYPPIVQVELISGYLHCFLEFGELRVAFGPDSCYMKPYSYRTRSFFPD